MQYMDNTDFTRLDLRSPLFFRRDDTVSLSCLDTNTGVQTPDSKIFPEQAFCFELDPMQSRSFEPESKAFLTKLLFSGIAQQEVSNRTLPEIVQIPAGLYYFTQITEGSGKDGYINLAIRQQKNALWEKYTLSNILYIRLLYEDERYVVQLFRPLINCML